MAIVLVSVFTEISEFCSFEMKTVAQQILQEKYLIVFVCDPSSLHAVTVHGVVVLLLQRITLLSFSVFITICYVCFCALVCVCAKPSSFCPCSYTKSQRRLFVIPLKRHYFHSTSTAEHEHIVQI